MPPFITRCGGVGAVVALEKLANRLWMFALRVCQGIWFSIHLERRGDGPKRHRDCLGANFVFSGRNATVSHIVGEGSKEIELEFSMDVL